MAQPRRQVVLVVEDDKATAETIEKELKSRYEVVVANTTEDGLAKLADPTFTIDCVVLDLLFGPEDDPAGLRMLEEMERRRKGGNAKERKRYAVPVILHTNAPSKVSALEALRYGAFSVLYKLYDPLERFLDEVSLALDIADDPLEQIVGESDGIWDVKYKVMRYAWDGMEDWGEEDSRAVLIVGETGTGKELVAKALHGRSTRRDKVPVIVNAARLDNELVNSALFGYGPKSFTGADPKGRKGLFESANGSTLFLDEVGELPMDTQVKLLRVIATGIVVREGENVERGVDVRLVAATNRNVRDAIRNNEFRRDLYERVRHTEIEMPPLRERQGDVLVLAEHFVDMYVKQRYASSKNEWMSTATETRERCMRTIERAGLEGSGNRWNGNVRQLRRRVNQLIKGPDAGTSRAGDQRDRDLAESADGTVPIHVNPEETFAKQEEDAKRQIVEEALRRSAGNVKGAADALGKSPSWLHKLGLDLNAIRERFGLGK